MFGADGVVVHDFENSQPTITGSHVGRSRVLVGHLGPLLLNARLGHCVKHINVGSGIDSEVLRIEGGV